MNLMTISNTRKEYSHTAGQHAGPRQIYVILRRQYVELGPSKSTARPRLFLSLGGRPSGLVLCNEADGTPNPESSSKAKRGTFFSTSGLHL